MLNIILLVGGLVGLVVGGEFLVRGAVSVARSLNVSPLVIGLTLVGFGTSMPELVTSLQAALIGSPGIAIGNVVGSNIANILLILAIAALIRPITVDPMALKRDGGVMLLATLLCIAAVSTQILGRPTGAAFIFVLALYLGATLFIEKRRATPAGGVYEAETRLVADKHSGTARALITALAGLALTIAGARAMVLGAVGLAQAAGVSETVIGLTIVAVGTSLPELVASVIAVRRGEGDVAFGNVIGSNIFNILGILGVVSLVRPLEVPQSIIVLDIWVMLAASIAMVVFAFTGRSIRRHEAALLLLGYCAYMTVLGVTA